MRPKPPIPLVVCSVAIIGVCALLISIFLAAFIAAWDPIAILGGLIIIPLAVLLAQRQYRGTFRNTANAARSSALLLLFASGFIFFLLISLLIESLYGLQPVPLLSLVAPMFVIGLAGFYSGWLNLCWSRRLKSLAATTEWIVTPTGFSLRELFLGVSVIAILTGMTTYFLKTIPPQYAEHVSREKAPGNLPPGASDISFSQGGRGTIAYEFTIDEAGFIEWVNSGTGSFESEAANVSLKPITTPYEITRYGAFIANTNAPDSILVSDGLYYDWSKEDRGVHAAFDRKTNRAYYSAHFH